MKKGATIFLVLGIFFFLVGGLIAGCRQNSSHFEGKIEAIKTDSVNISPFISGLLVGEKHFYESQLEDVHQLSPLSLSAESFAFDFSPKIVKNETTKIKISEMLPQSLSPISPGQSIFWGDEKQKGFFVVLRNSQLSPSLQSFQLFVMKARGFAAQSIVDVRAVHTMADLDESLMSLKEFSKESLSRDGEKIITFTENTSLGLAIKHPAHVRACALISKPSLKIQWNEVSRPLQLRKIPAKNSQVYVKGLAHLDKGLAFGQKIGLKILLFNEDNLTSRADAILKYVLSSETFLSENTEQNG